MNELDENSVNRLVDKVEGFAEMQGLPELSKEKIRLAVEKYLRGEIKIRQIVRGTPSPIALYEYAATL